MKKHNNIFNGFIFKKLLIVLLLLTIAAFFTGCKNEDKPEEKIQAKIMINDEISLNEVCDVVVVNQNDNSSIINYTCVSENSVLLYNDGKIFAIEEGNGRITVTFNNGKDTVSKDIAVVKNEYAYSNISISSDKSGVLVGKELKLSASFIDNGSEDKILWKSSNDEIATVDSTGVVTGKSVGEVYITAYSNKNNNAKKTFNVIIFAAELTNETSLTNGFYKATEILYRTSLGNDVTFLQDKGVTASSSTATQSDQVVSILNIPKNQEIKTFVWANVSDSRWHLMTLSNMVKDFETNNPGWTVLGAINGGSFDINGNLDFPYQSRGPLVCDGNVYLTTEQSNGKWTGVYGFNNDINKDCIVANEEITVTDYFVLTTFDKDGNKINDYKVDTYNHEPEDGQTSVYYGSYSNNVYSPINMPLINTYAVYSHGTSLQNSATDFYGKGEKQETPDSSIGFNEFGIVTKNDEIAKAINNCDTVRVQRELTGAYKGVENVFGAGHIVLKDGIPTPNVEADLDETGAPRTVIGTKEDGSMVFCVVDGRQANNGMSGVTGARMSAIMANYGCVDAYNLDGGGSSTVIIRTESGFKVMNSPSDGNERSDGNCLIIAVRNYDFEIEVESSTSSSVTLTVDNSNSEFNSYKKYLEINGELYSSVNNKFTINDLESNTRYSYTLCYDNENGDFVKTAVTGSFTTEKTGFKYLGMTMEETEDSFIFSIYYEDIENASSIRTARIEVNGEKYYIIGGKVTVKKEDIGETIDDVYLRYSYSDNGESHTFEDYITYFVIE